MVGGGFIKAMVERKKRCGMDRTEGAKMGDGNKPPGSIIQ